MRHILRASATAGLGSIVVIASGIVRAKAIAVGLGPQGIGYLGLLLTFVSLASTLVGVGLSNSGVRHIAATTPDDSATFASAVKGLLVGAHSLALLGSGILLVSAVLLPGLWKSSALSETQWVVWSAVAVWATVAGQGHIALINGLRRVKDFAQINALGAGLGTALLLAALRFVPEVAVGVAVVATPLMTLGVSVWKSRGVLPVLRQAVGDRWRAECGKMLRLGAVFMTTLSLGAATQFAVRLLVESRLGLEAAGFYQASYSITQLYLGFVLSALAAEYYPRLSELVTRFGNDAEEVRTAAMDQARMALTLVTPVIVWAIVLAPVVIDVLYSRSFEPTVEVLRWQFVGDILKVFSWPFAFLLLARDNRLRYFAIESLWSLSYISFIFILINKFNLVSISYAYIISYAIYSIATLLASFDRKTVGPPARFGGMVLSVMALLVLSAWASARPGGLWWSAAIASVLTGGAMFALNRFLGISFGTLRNRLPFFRN